jgi:SAM-dependent MidA family methyltransferase
MVSSPDSSPPISPEFLALFRAEAGPAGVMTFARFMELALYHPHLGYYRRPSSRIGRHPGSDFYTSATSAPVFGELVSAACIRLLGDRDPRAHVFVELGAEAGRSVLAGVKHPFRRVETRQEDEPLALAGDCVVFSNELFDAQPCQRTVYRQGQWHELGVRLAGERLIEVEVPADFPEPGCEGHHFDRPRAAAELAATIAAQPWRGLLVAIDYGKTLEELLFHTPAGTARAYHRHVQSNDLLARPGEQDLTCHICWDWMSRALRAHGFGEPKLEFQESFLLHHAADLLAMMCAAGTDPLDPRKLALRQLLHPSHLGQKFQVLHALR